MSNNVATNTKNEGRCSFSRKALSVATAAVLATSMVPMLPAESAWADQTIVQSINVADKTLVNGKATLHVAYGELGANYTVKLLKSGVVVDTYKCGEQDPTANVTFDVYSGGFYSVQVADADGNLVKQDTLITVTDEAANNAWNGHKLVLSQDEDADGEYWFKETGKAVDFTISDVLGLDGKTSIGSENYVVKYYTTSDGGKDWDDNTGLVDGTGAAPSEAGYYLVAAWPAEDYITGVTVPLVQYFEIADVAEASEYSLYQISEDGSTDDTTFVYTGSDLIGTVGLLVDGKAVELATSDDNENYYIAGIDNDGDADYSDSGIVGAGDYSLKIADKDDNVVAYLDLKVLPFDFSKAEVSLSDNTGTSKMPVATFTYEGVSVQAAFSGTANGLTFTSNDVYPAGDSADGSLADADTKITMTVVGFENAPKDTVLHPLSAFVHNGTYTVVINAVGADEKTGIIADATNFAFTGDALEAQTRKVTTDISSSITYTGEVTQDDDVYDSDYDGTSASTPYVINKEEGQAFDATKFQWTNGGTVKYNGSNATVAITKDGEAVSSMDVAGDYVVTVSTTPDGNFSAAGTKVFYFKVVNSTAAATVYMTFDGKPVVASQTYTVSETGEAYAYGVQVKSGSEKGGLLTEGEDYEVVVTNEDGDEVSEIKLAGTYTVTVSNIGGYEFNDTSFTVVVSPKSFTGLVAVQPTYGYSSEYSYANTGVAQETGYAYTGEAVEPVFGITYTDAEGEEAYIVLDESLYEVTYKDAKGYDVKASDLKKAADGYVATVVVDQEAFEAVYGEGATIGSGWTFTDTFNIVDAVAGFNDVKASEWYADSVVKAKQLGYVEGYGSSYVPLANITRADFTIILARINGYDMTDSEKDYPTIFEDVAASDYFAWAVDWAYKTGVTTGTSETTFDPHAFLTREMAATMLYRAFGAGESADLSVLDAYSDADQLTFGKEAMAWCVENGIFGVDTAVLNPQGNASRADIAALAVRVAPAEEA